MALPTRVVVLVPHPDGTLSHFLPLTIGFFSYIVSFILS